MKRITTKTFVQKKGLEKLALVTAYDAIFAKIADSAGVDAILVGDSVGNTFMGFENTLPVTMDDMLHHVSMVARAKPRALVIADVPFAIAQATGSCAAGTPRRSAISFSPAFSFSSWGSMGLYTAPLSESAGKGCFVSYLPERAPCSSTI